MKSRWPIETQSLLIKSFREFDTIYNGEGNAAFYYRSRSIQKQIQAEITPHVGKITDELSDTIKQNLKNALVYRTMARCISEWDYEYIPSPIKRGINNDYSLKSGKEVETVKERVSAKFLNISDSYLKKIDFEKEQAKQAAIVPTIDIKINGYQPKPSDKHILMM